MPTSPQAGYEDSLATAQRLGAAVDALIAAPSAEALQAARAAWLAARVPYQQTEAFRFGNAIVDDWEGKVNAWPLDEGLIDYVDAELRRGDRREPLRRRSTSSPTRASRCRPATVDAAEITPALLADTLQEADAIESNVATGYHAIEFLLWGQDLNGTGPGAGNRPWTDYAAGRRLHRRQLRPAGGVPEGGDRPADRRPRVDGGAVGRRAARRATAVTADPDAGVVAILTGMGSLSYGEQAGERMRLGLMLHDPEEEHDCFSDNTYNSHYYDGLGVRNVYLGRYVRVDGSVVEGPSVSELVAEADPAARRRPARGRSTSTMLALGAIKTAAEAGTHYDQLLATGNAAGEALVMAAVDALVAQTRSIERAVVGARARRHRLRGLRQPRQPGRGVPVGDMRRLARSPSLVAAAVAAAGRRRAAP